MTFYDILVWRGSVITWPPESSDMINHYLFLYVLLKLPHMTALHVTNLDELKYHVTAERCWT
jgi:hypothetical protein